MRLPLLTALVACALAGCASGEADDELETDSTEQALAWDGAAPWNTSCWNDRRFVQSTHLLNNGNGQFMNPIIYLYYSSSCRTTWARITGGTVADTESSGGYAQIIRNSDGLTYTC